MPSLMVAGSIAFAVVLIEADSAGSDRWLSQWPRLFGVGPEGARGRFNDDGYGHQSTFSWGQ